MPGIFLILQFQCLRNTNSVIFNNANELIILFLKLNMNIYFSFFSIHAMPYGIFNKRLNEHRRQYRFIGFKGEICFHVKMKIRIPDLFHFDISVQVVHGTSEGYKRLPGLIKCNPDKVSKIAKETRRFLRFIMEYHFADAIETVKNKMGIHL